MRLGIGVLLICGVFLSGNAHARRQVFKHFTIQDGLPSSQVYRIKQSSDGQVILCTDRGIVFYNGYDFRTYTIQDGIPENVVLDAYEDHLKRIWFYTFEWHFFYYQGDSIVQLGLDAAQRSSIRKTDPGHAFFVDSTGVIWVEHTSLKLSSGLLRVTPNLQVTWKPISDTTKRYHVICYDHGKYLIVTNKTGSDKKVTLHSGQTIDFANIPEQYLQGSPILLESDSAVILGAVGGVDNEHNSVIRIDKSNHSVEFKTFCTPINHLLLDKAGNLWTAQLHEGVKMFKNSRLKQDPERYLSNESVTSIMEDHEGGMWFSTLNNGVFYQPWEDITLYNNDDRLSYSLTVFDSAVFVGFSDNKLGIFDLRKDTFELVQPDPSLGNKTTEINIAANGDNLLVNIFSKVFQFEHHERKWFNVTDDFTRDIFCDDLNNLWLMSDGVSLIAGDTMVYNSQHKSDFKLKTNVIHQTDSSYLLGTHNGLYEMFYGENGGVIHRHHYSDSILNSRISDVKVRNGVVVYTTIGNGVFVEKNQHFYRLIKGKNSLSSNVCNAAVFENDSVFWVSTNRGLSKITMRQADHEKAADPFFMEVQSISKNDNLKSDEFRMVHLIGDQIWAATNSGLLTFKTHTFDMSRFQVRPVVQNIRIGEQEVAPDKGLHFPYDQNDLSVSYYGVFLKNPSRISYRYRLDSEGNWTYTPYTSFEQIDLPHGKYLLEIEASLDGVSWYGLAEGPIDFEINAPWWLGSIFLTSIAFFLAMTLIFLFNLRSESIKRKEALKRRVLELEYTAMKVQLNPHFMFNSLNTINSFILENDRFTASRYLTKYSRLMRQILDNSMESWVALRKEIETLSSYIEMEALRAQHGFKYEVQCDERLDQERSFIPPMLIQPFIENAIWHGLSALEERTGILTVKFCFESDHMLTCLIMDNGIGQEQAGKLVNKNKVGHRSYGMKLLEQRLKILGRISGKQYGFTIENGVPRDGSALVVDQGTTVKLRLPLNIHDYV